MAVGYIRRRLGVVAVKAQCLTLFGRLDSMGHPVVIAAGRRRRADAFAAKQGYTKERVCQAGHDSARNPLGPK
jgi:hypothetical protein